jgi:hypothetical protein
VTDVIAGKRKLLKHEEEFRISINFRDIGSCIFPSLFPQTAAEWIGVAVKLWTRIGRVLGSNLGRDPSYPE